MRINLLIVAATIFLFALAVPQAQGEIHGADSLEWMAIHSDFIARCRVVEIADEDPDPSPAHGWKRVVFEVIKPFKGEPAQHITVRYGGLVDPDLNAWLASGEEHLLFFARTDRLTNSYESGFKKYPYYLRDPWRLERRNRYDEPNHPEIAFLSDFSVLDDRAQIERALQAAIAEKSSPPTQRIVVNDHWWLFGAHVGNTDPPWFSLEVPFESPANRELFAGSMCYVTVPLDTRLRDRAFGWYAARSNLSNAIAVLQYFKSERSVALMKDALNDTSYRSTRGHGPGGAGWYPIRHSAFDALHTWGIDVPRPIMDFPADVYHRVRFGLAGLVLACFVGIGLLSIVFYRVRRASGERNRSAVSHHYRPAIFDAVCAALIIAAGGLVLLSLNSAQTARNATVSLGDTRYWAWVNDHQLTLCRSINWATPADLSIASISIQESPVYFWSVLSLSKTTVREWHGLRYTSGSITDFVRETPTSSPAVSMSGPVWSVASMMALLPLVRLGVVGRAVFRRRRRRRRGQCLACGYDLRGGHDRCPECGAAVVASRVTIAAPYV